MDRYREEEISTAGKRTRRNEHLYARVEAPLEYSSVEGVAKIENTNSVDINKIKELLLREEEQTRKPRSIVKEPEPIIEEPDTTGHFDDKTYDIRDILSKAKVEKPEEDEDRYRALQNTGYDILKNIQVKNNHADISEKELDSVGDTTLSLSMLDSLKGNELTGTIDSNTIRALLDSEKKELEKDDDDDFEEQRTLDNSFFTSSLNFSEDDFNELNEELDGPKKKNHLFFKVILFLLLVVITTVAIFFFAKYLK